MNQNTSTHQTLWNLIKDIKFGMFTHRSQAGMMHAHPLTTQNKSVDESATLYFFIPNNGEIAKAIATDPQVCVSYADPGSDSYVSASGDASLVQDQAKKEELFTSFAKAWFPGGATDPNLGLLTVRIRHAEYWDVDESKMVQLFKMAKAAFTGDTPGKLGEHKEVLL
jgi:general stress protein 26